MAEYNLEQLGPIGFQDLAAALCIAEFGPGVQVMGAGRDGGRDLYYRGTLLWSRQADRAGEVWDGYTVFQVKHKTELAARPAHNTAWLWGEIRSELAAWSQPDGGRNPVPDHVVVISNVPLTAVPGSGGHDTILANIGNYIDALADVSREVDRAAAARRRARHERLLRIKKWRVWDGNQVTTLLRTNAGVRRAFPAFLTAADVFATIGEFTVALPLAELEPALRAHARTALTGESLIYFDDAGSGDTTGFPLHEIAIDLPATDGAGRRSTLVGQILARAEHVLKPGVTTVATPRHVIVTGAPGNGKTTIAKFLVQIFRAALLEGALALSADQTAIIEGTQSAVRRLGYQPPRHRRWPMRVDLALYAEEGGLADDSTLLRWIAHKISRRLNHGDLKPSALQSWMEQWPWLLVLDGLDEVTEPQVRKRLIAQVVEFVNDAEAEKCDVLVVLTTRPMGYTENIAPNHFERVDLDDLEIEQAMTYGETITKIRLHNDLDRIDRVTGQLRRAALDESLSNLLRTPLQVLILTIIIEGAGRVAPDRYSLFWGYYDTVFKRERTKIGGLSRILQEYGQQIQILHQQVGFDLQTRSERGDHSAATLTAEDLKQVVWRVLSQSGYRPSDDHAHLLDNIFIAATRRLVLIAPRGDHGYGFDVRSLQELMAAMQLTSGPIGEVITRLRSTIASPHWRNTWIFAAGRLFATPQPHEHDAVVELVESADAGAHHRLGDIVPVGPRLALELVDDGMARSLPMWRDRLVAQGLHVLREPAADDIATLARILVRYAASGDQQRRQVADGLRDALAMSPTAQATALAFQALVPGVADELPFAPLAVRGLSGVRRRNQTDVPEPVDRWEDFDAEIATSPLDGDRRRNDLAAAAAALHRLRTTPDGPQGAAGRAESDAAGGPLSEADVDQLLAVLDEGDTARALTAALLHLTGYEPQIALALRSQVAPIVHRRPVDLADHSSGTT